MSVRFCWLCGNKLYGNHKEELTIDRHSRTLHKSCAKKVKTQYDFKKEGSEYHTMIWQSNDSDYFIDEEC